MAVTLVADQFGKGTTSDGSGGLWEPYKLGDTPADLINKWGAETYQHLQVGPLLTILKNFPARLPSPSQALKLSFPALQSSQCCSKPGQCCARGHWLPI